MSGAGFTPGPWVLSTYDLPHNGGLFCAIDGSDGLGIVYATLRERAELEANARLIAAAPELLEAAEGLASDVQCLVDCRADCGEWGAECPLQDAHKPDGTIERLQRLLDAIAKARGAQ